jgi:ABC-type multidrug transport system ATPase subunit
MKFDRLMLLAEGHMVYNGPTKDVVAYFAKLGYKCPEYTNPSEFISTPSIHSPREAQMLKRLRHSEPGEGGQLHIEQGGRRGTLQAPHLGLP